MAPGGWSFALALVRCAPSPLVLLMLCVVVVVVAPSLMCLRLSWLQGTLSAKFLVCCLKSLAVPSNSRTLTPTSCPTPACWWISPPPGSSSKTVPHNEWSNPFASKVRFLGDRFYVWFRFVVYPPLCRVNVALPSLSFLHVVVASPWCCAGNLPKKAGGHFQLLSLMQKSSYARRSRQWFCCNVLAASREFDVGWLWCAAGTCVPVRFWRQTHGITSRIARRWKCAKGVACRWRKAHACWSSFMM